MSNDYDRMYLSSHQLRETRAFSRRVRPEFLDPKRTRPNVVGMGVGVKWKAGQPSGEQALVVLVSRKLPKDQLTADELIPEQIEGMQTDVIDIGSPRANSAMAVTEPVDLKSRARPARGGWSIGHLNVTAGTLGVCFSDGNSVPQRFFILSNNHVLANSNNAQRGDTVIQPGPADGGRYPADAIGILDRFMPITFEPEVDRSKHQNLIDAAVAEGQFEDLDPQIEHIGYLRGWIPAEIVNVGTTVQKTGRTTGYTTGRIMVVDATVDVGYDDGKVARFHDQIITTAMSSGGDSGSVVTTLDSLAVGLLFAGSERATIVNQIEHVQNLLGIQIAPKQCN